MSDLIAGGRSIFDDDEPIRKVTDVFLRITDEHEYRIGISEHLNEEQCREFKSINLASSPS